ncbi:S1 RNA-binding domain-containing protein [Patescibacteria group bacterium]|nr:S1 RNA-binding domain-containing protein [Patescibacteria group bacterium]MBU4162283.1 S1 RNA-binding domain-containing protein [Patescibacteria group bacterium]
MTKIIEKTIQPKDELQNIATPPKKGQTIEGKIIGAGHFAVYVDLGPVGVGVIYGKEYYAAKDIIKRLQPEALIKAKIVEVDNEDGYLELSLTDAQKEVSWETLKETEKASQTVMVDIAGANKGGLLAEMEGIKGFLPLSQLSIKNYPRVKDGDSNEILKHLQKLVGQQLEVKIIDVSPQENKLIFSEKAVTSKAINELLEQYKVNDIVEGKITGLADFGAFIKFPLLKESGAEELKLEKIQAEGLIHISELDWQLIDNVSDVVKVGDIIKAKITEISQDGRVSLSLKALKEDPWKDIDKKYKKNDIIEGEVVKINQLGAFIEIEPKIRGLIHLSEFNNQDKEKESLQKGKKYKFEIIALDIDTHRMGLRLKNG